MRARILAIALLASLSAFAACDTSTGPLRLGVAGVTPGIDDTVNVARIRFVNATATSAFDVAQAGVVGSGDGSLRFGASSRCFLVASTAPNLDVRTAGTTVRVPGFNLTLQSAGRYTVIAYTDAAGATQFVTLFNSFTPLGGQAGFIVFSAVTSGAAYDIYASPPTLPLEATTPAAAGVVGGLTSRFVSLDISTPLRVRITPAGSTTVLLDVGNVALLPDMTTILVVAPPAQGSPALRTVLVTGC